VHKLLGLRQGVVVADALLDEILHRLDVVVGGGLDRLDALPSSTLKSAAMALSVAICAGAKAGSSAIAGSAGPAPAAIRFPPARAGASGRIR
jgi:hypothetical protein